jgi:hypothetical protein
LIRSGSSTSVRLSGRKPTLFIIKMDLNEEHHDKSMDLLEAIRQHHGLRREIYYLEHELATKRALRNKLEAKNKEEFEVWENMIKGRK